MIRSACRSLRTIAGACCNERGEDFVEYAFLAGAIGIVAFGVFLLLTR